ncbi:DNA topoisomerase I, mitochondrial isoform X1 [Hylaeus anthracinus]|uniref:DNA topoisomerase I, mitochondrial isoform X1 n=1 Tax=Hylaeus anthracinus TaxID=313031 RepID=UPI0023B89727|nr:DNA topoisomerase I, mitochondrial isoform X1 [Hylaeus anthracinus]
MELEQQTTQSNSDLERKVKENSNTTGNHNDAHTNGMSNGFDKKREHKSEHKDKDKERSHKSEHKDKERSKEKDRNHKSEHRDKDRDKHKHSSNSFKEKDKHDSSNKDKDKDKDKKSSSSSSKDKEHKSSSSSSKEKEKDKSKDREHHHKSSSSSKDKDRHHSSSKDKENSNKEKDKDKNKDRDKDKHKHSLSSSSRDKDKDKSISKDKEKDKEKEKKHSSERHSTSHTNDKEKQRSSEKDKDKHNASNKEKHRHDKDKDRHRHDKEKSKHKEERDKKPKEKDEIKVKEEQVDEKPNHLQNTEFHYNELYFKTEAKEEPVSQIEPEDDDDSGGEQPLYIKEDENEEEPANEEDASMDSTDGNDTRLSDLHNTTIKTEDDSEEDTPLSARSTAPNRRTKRLLDSEEEEDDNVPLSARKKSKKTDTKTKKKKRKFDDDGDEEIEQKPKKKAGARASKGENPSPRKKKQEEEQEVWKWWEEEKKNDGTKWTFLEHKGPVFAPAYEPLPPDVKFYYNGKEMKLSEDAEEVATFYARMLDHDYTTKPAFNTNFFHDWREVMTESERSKIVDLSKCNFKEMHAYFLQKSEERKAMTKEEKQKVKEMNEEIQKEYGFCTIDGHKEKIGNFKIEPPGLFRGRGEHPKMGKLKRRVVPEDILINCSKDSNIPKPPVGHKWKEIRHDPNVTWLASWTENIQGQVKYVMLNPSSKLKGEKDWQKYETARKLAQSIDKIRAEYREDWKSKEMRIRQRAVALYFIDKLALRAGNEKDEDQADTVGCCSLRVEHISLHEQKDGKEYVVVFDFLGKDSIRYYNEVPVEKRVFKNLQLFMENKSPSDDLFDRLNTTVMNKHLNELMEGLTAKVFRTYNASWTLQQQLDKLTNPDDTEAEKILSYNRANRAVAILCNHQRSVPKTHAKSMENLKAKIEAKKEAIADAELAVKDAKRDAKNGSVKEKVVYEKKKKTLDRLKDQLTKLEVQATDKEENKEIALGTSKLNYLDPRISVAWCKKNNVPIEKIYNKTQRDKFRWAIDMAGPDYVF